MRNIKRGLFAILILVSFLYAIGFSYQSEGVNASTKIDVSVNSPNKTYELGEVVPLNIEITNNSSTVFYLSEELVERMEIQISADGSNYLNYVGQGRRFNLLEPPIKIKLQETFTKQNTILWNSVPNVSHLNLKVAKRILKNENRILTEYAFTKTETYFIKSVLTVSKDGGESIKVDSKPIKITIKAPKGEDLEVWNRIKDDGEIAYFIQQSDFRIPRHKTEERKKLQQKIEQIIITFPNSSYAQTLQNNLQNFRIAEEKQRENLRKLQIGQPLQN